MGTKMFQFPTFPSYTLLYSCMDIQSFFTVWVPSFGHPRLDGYLLLPVAFRSLSRPSSALSAKASSLRSLQLNLQNSLAILVWSVLHSVALQTWLFLNCFVFPLMLLNGLGCLLFLMIGMLLPFIFLSRCLRSFDLSQARYWYLRLFSMFSFQGTIWLMIYQSFKIRSFLSLDHW